MSDYIAGDPNPVDKHRATLDRALSSHDWLQLRRHLVSLETTRAWIGRLQRFAAPAAVVLALWMFTLIPRLLREFLNDRWDIQSIFDAIGVVVCGCVLVGLSRSENATQQLFERYRVAVWLEYQKGFEAFEGQGGTTKEEAPPWR